MKLANNVKEKICELADFKASNFWQDLYNDFEEGGIESPIEQIFYAQWKYEEETYHSSALFLRPQFQILKYKVDFEVDSFSYFLNSSTKPDIVSLEQLAVELPKVVIELDGHDFHEKTAEQVSRDKSREREIVAAGYTMFRFSGREVVRCPEKCVNEVMDFVRPKRNEVWKKYSNIGGW